MQDRVVTIADAQMNRCIHELADAVRGLLQEWDTLTRQGSPIAKAHNVRVENARATLERWGLTNERYGHYY